jgi:purine-cytosine permease-like protein
MRPSMKEIQHDSPLVDVSSVQQNQKSMYDGMTEQVSAWKLNQAWLRFIVLFKPMNWWPKEEKKNWSGGVRFAIFLFAVVMAFSELIKNLSANLISFGTDSACLMPKYLNINRGMILGLTIGFVMQARRILVTAKTYLTFLTVYSLFLGAIPAIAIVDYGLRKGNIDVVSHYTDKKGTSNAISISRPSH